MLLANVANAAPVVTVIAPEITAQTAQGQSKVPVEKGHIKFKSGPVCMCGKGMSERDIEQAESKSKQDKVSDSESSR